MVEVSASGFPLQMCGKLKFRPEKQKGSNARFDPSAESTTLTLHVNVRERHNRLSRDGASEGLGRCKNREQQSAVQLFPYLFIITSGNDAVVFHASAGIHIGLNHHGRIQVQLVLRILGKLQPWRRVKR